METIGTYLRKERELRDMSLAELSQVTRIPVLQLRRIEADALHELPGEIFVKGFLRAVATTLGLSADDVIKRLNRRASTPTPPSTPAPVTPMVTPDRGRRFGFAVALVVLVILFTLAISIVLQPRQTDVPIELSSAPATDLSSS